MATTDFPFPKIDSESAEGESGANLTDTVYRALLDGISSGRIPPGTRLVHRKLAKQMGTSNNPVVAALRQLEGVGLLVNRPGEGSEVRRWDVHQYEESVRIRAALEGVAYRYFATRATEDDFKIVESYSQAYDAGCDAGDWEACVQADRNLHIQIVKGSRSDELIRMVENASLILLTARWGVLPAELKQVGFRGDHDALIAALKSGDPDIAEAEGRKHLLQSSSFNAVQELIANAAVHNKAERIALSQIRAAG